VMPLGRPLGLIAKGPLAPKPVGSKHFKMA